MTKNRQPHVIGFAFAGLVAVLSTGAAQHTDGRPALPEAPPPRSVADSRCKLEFLQEVARSPNHSDPAGPTDGLHWHMNAGVARLPILGTELILFRWSMWYTGLRQPLVIQRPSLLHLDGGTIARFYAFPPDQKVGRVFDYFDDATVEQAVEWAGGRWAPEGYHLFVKRGRVARGTIVVPVADLRDRLRALYPVEFGGNVPPKLYASLIHRALDRGFNLDM